MPTAQELFDQIVTGLRAQGKPSVDASDNCVYRSADGCRCAIGMVIPDDKYVPEMDIFGEGRWSFGEVLDVCGLTEHEELLCLLQSAHDEAWGGLEDTVEFVEILQGIAGKFDLDSKSADEWAAAL